MHEALIIFESLIHSEWFKVKPIILFLNKMDLFKTKLAVSPVSEYFPDYRGEPTDFKAASKYFADRFCNVNRNSYRDIYTHYTNATDTELLNATMTKVQNIIVQKNFRSLRIL
jgi:guanine nucleotide-binding protein subunit alpha